MRYSTGGESSDSVGAENGFGGTSVSRGVGRSISDN